MFPDMKRCAFVLMLFCSATFAQKYVITRRIKSPKTIQIQPDLVQIPSSLCRDNGTTECSLINGQRHSICQCVCNNTDGLHGFYESTFGFYNGSWKCERNAETRRQSGCIFSLDGASGSFPDVTISLKSTTRHSMSSAINGSKVSLPVGTTCYLRAENSSYLKCNGEWAELDSTIVIKRFRISYAEPNNGRHIVLIWVNSTEDLVHMYPPSSGRIIRLAVTCSDRRWESSQCFVVKVQGELECPVSSFVTTLPLVQQSAASHLSSIPSYKEPVRPATTQFTARKPSAQTSTKSSTNTVPNVQNSDDDSGTIFSHTVIGVALGGVGVLVMLVIIIVLVARKRQATRGKDQRKISSTAFVIENESFEQQEDLEDEAHHPYVIRPSFLPSTGFYTPDDVIKQQPDRQGHRDSVENKVYEFVEELSQPASKPDAEGTFEGQQDPACRTRKKPFYAVTQAPVHTNVKYPHLYESVPEPHYDTPAAYDVLEGPTQPNSGLPEEFFVGLTSGRQNRGLSTSNKMNGKY